MIPRAHVAAELPDLANPALIAALLDRLQQRGLISLGERTVALKDHQAKLSQGERRLKDELLSAIRAGGFSPPDVADLTKVAGARAPVVPDLLSLLRDEEQIVAISSSFYLSFETADDLRHRVTAALADGSALTLAELRDLLGTTRKYAVPIAEYLDREGVTVRDGDLRRLNTET